MSTTARALAHPGWRIAPATLVLVAWIGGCEREQSRFPTLADARRTGAVDRGWIPQWVPPGATEIEEAHDLDTNVQRLKFKAPAGEIEGLGEALPRLRLKAICPSRGAPRIAGDWPAEVEAGAAAWSLTYRKAEARSGAPLAVAIDRTASTVYAWSCAEPPGKMSP